MADLDDLIRQAAGNPPLALQPQVCEALMGAYYNFVYHLTTSFLGDTDEADDATQETFLQATAHIDQYTYGTNLKSWIAKIAINICRVKYRRQKARRRLEQVLQNLTLQMNRSAPSPEEAYLRTERQRMVKQAIDALDEKHRLPVLLRYVHGLTVPEIASILEEKEGTIYSRIHYAHQQLRKRLGSQFLGEPDSQAKEET